MVREYLSWGVHHIFVGYDHIAFLLALLLAVTRLRELLLIVTSFTVAHSVTLLLSGLGILRIPSRLSELLVAASIVYVAVENLRRAGKPLPRRWLLTFLFGLVHGLGFATELQERLVEVGGRVLLPVLSFNLGVELGQVAIVALVYPLLVWMRRAPTAPERQLRQNRLLRMGSVQSSSSVSTGCSTERWVESAREVGGDRLRQAQREQVRALGLGRHGVDLVGARPTGAVDGRAPVDRPRRRSGRCWSRHP